MDTAAALALREFREAYSTMLLKAEQLRRVLEAAAGESIDPMLLIVQTVATTFRTSPGALLGTSRMEADILPRWVAMQLCWDLLGESLHRIGATFGRKDHTGVLFALRRLPERFAQDKHLAHRAEVARAQCIAALHGIGIAA